MGHRVNHGQGLKKPGFLKKAQPSWVLLSFAGFYVGFFGLFWVILGFIGFYVTFIWFLVGFMFGLL